MRPAADGRPEQLSDVGPGQRPTDHGKPQLEPADRGVQEAHWTGGEGLGNHQQLAESPSDDGPWHGPHDDVQQVVGAQ